MCVRPAGVSQWSMTMSAINHKGGDPFLGASAMEGQQRTKVALASEERKNQSAKPFDRRAVLGGAWAGNEVWEGCVPTTDGTIHGRAVWETPGWGRDRGLGATVMIGRVVSC